MATANVTWTAPTTGTTPFTYTIQTRLTSTAPNGAWTDNPSGPTQQLSQMATGLTDGTPYDLRVKVDNISGISNFSNIVEFTTPGVTPPPPPGESPDPTLITTAAVNGSPSITNSVNEVYTLTSGGQIAINGVTEADTAAVLELYYTNHLVYQKASNGNALGTPGWWSEATSAGPWVDTTDPTAVSPPPPPPPPPPPGGGGGATPIVAPLSGSVTAGTWLFNQHQTLGGSPGGGNFMNYNLLLPAQYSASFLYPVLFMLHPDFAGMDASGNYPKDGNTFITTSGANNGKSYDTLYNNVSFRTNWPCIIVVPQCDQTGGNDQATNWGGFNDTMPNSGWNERAVNALLATIIATYSVDPNRHYIFGTSLGGIGTLAALVDNNQQNGVGLKLWTAGATFSDQLQRSATPNSSVFGRMSTVPLLTVGINWDNDPTSYDNPAWTSYTGNTNFPALSNYTSGGMAGIRAASTQFYYYNNGPDQPDDLMTINALGGIGTPFFNWLFSFSSVTGGGGGGGGGGSSGGPGPAASGAFINVDFGVLTGNALSPWLFGSSMASDGPNDFGSDGNNWGSSGVQNSAKNIAGFGLPGMFARSNSNETTLNSDGSPALDKVDRISQFLPKIISMPTSATDLTHGQFSFSLGVQSPDGIGGVSPATYAASALTIHKRFIANGTQIWFYEVGNEPNGRTDPTAYCNVVNAVAQTLHGFDPSIRIIAGTTAAIGDANPAIDAIGFTTTVAQQCGSNLDIMSYHNYSTDGNGFNGYAQQIRQAMAGTACANKPTMAGEYNQDGGGGGNSDQRTMHGCLVNIQQMYGTWKTDPNTIIGARWDWLGDGDYGMIGDPQNGNPPGLGALNVIPWGYATKNLRSCMGGKEVSVTNLPGGVQAVATMSGANFGLWLINTSGQDQTGQIALSRWPVNTTGNGSVNIDTVSATFPQSSRTTAAVSGGTTAAIKVPANSVVTVSVTGNTGGGTTPPPPPPPPSTPPPPPPPPPPTTPPPPPPPPGGGTNTPNANVTVNFGSPTGKSISPYIYGVATGAFINNNFANCTDTNLQAAYAQLGKVNFVRFNCLGDIATTPGNYNNWWANQGSFLRPGARTMVGVGPWAGSSMSPTQYANIGSTLASNFKSNNRGITYWEVGNETAGGGLTLSQYESYFVPICKAIKSVDPNAKVGGPATLYVGGYGYNAGQFASDVASQGALADFFLYHQYEINASDDLQTVFYDSKGFNNQNIVNFRNELAGSPGANLEIFGPGEFNMSAGTGPGNYDFPPQQGYIGGVWLDLLLTGNYLHDSNFTMSGLWEAAFDSDFGIVGGDSNGGGYNIDAQGWYLGYASAHMPGPEYTCSSTLGNHLVVIASLPTPNTFTIKLTNWDVNNAQTAIINIVGRTPTGTITRWELGKSNNPPKIGVQASWSSVSVPSEQIVILTGSLS